ncbi:MAG: long-chain fatty acid--CoA ligase, partial [Propionibacteriales bacterium]|nr:long-chain fatty acid--CoA ligase [Propionibacteriales bacterium]
GHDMAGKSYTEVVRSAEMEKVIQTNVAELNAKLNPWETIKKFKILDRDLTIESGELTPSMKVKRRVVEDNNKELLDGFYA